MKNDENSKQNSPTARDVLEKEWQSRIEQSSRTSHFVQVRIRITIITTIFFAVLGLSGWLLTVALIQPKTIIVFLLSVLMTGAWVSILNLVLILFVIRGVRRYISVQRNLDKDTKRYDRLNPQDAAKLNTLLVPLCQKMGIDIDSIVPLRPLRSRGLSPSVVENEKGKVLLVVPDGFLELTTIDIGSAEAMLAHELGHVVQRDTNLWLYASAYADQVMRYFLPWYIVSGIVGLLLAVDLLGSNQAPDGIKNIIQAIFPLVMLIVFYFQIRRHRRSSEEMADLASWLFATNQGAGLRAAFALTESPNDKPNTRVENAASLCFIGESYIKRRLFPIHPTIPQRLKNIDLYDSVVSGAIKKVRLTSYSQRGDITLIVSIAGTLMLGVIGAILFPVFAQAREKSRQTICLSNSKQIALALMMYMQDYDEHLPPSPNSPPGSAFLLPTKPATSEDKKMSWTNQLIPYLKNLEALRCPAVPQGSYAKPPDRNNNDGTPQEYVYGTSYLYNGVLPPSFSEIARPAETIMVHETKQFGAPIYAPERVSKDFSLGTHFNHSSYDDNHSGGANLAFVDGHAKYSKKDKIPYSWLGASKTETLETNPTEADRAYDAKLNISFADDVEE